MNNFYTTLEEARAEIWRRWNDADLRKKVNDYYFQGDIPIFFAENPRAVLARSIATCDIEFLHFFDLAGSIDLKPLVFEDVDDKFATMASDKVGLAKLSFFDRYDKKGDPIITKKKIVDMARYDGDRFCDIQTLWGENLVDFHHRLLDKYAPEKIEVFNDIAWHNHRFPVAKNAKEYYRFLFVYFICYGIQFENYITDESEHEFFDEVVKPAFDEVRNIFGIAPLIVELVPGKEAEKPYWWCFDKAIYQNEIAGLLQGKS
jgi:hypothetical protein